MPTILKGFRDARAILYYTVTGKLTIDLPLVETMSHVLKGFRGARGMLYYTVTGKLTIHLPPVETMPPVLKGTSRR